MDSLDAQAHYELALGYWHKRKWDDADRALRRALAIQPRFASACLALGHLPYARRSSLVRDEFRGRVPQQWRPTLIEAERFRRRAFLLDPFVDLGIIGMTMDPELLERAVRLGDPFATFVVGDYLAAYNALNGIVRKRYSKTVRDSLPGQLLWYRGLAAAHLGADNAALYDSAIADFATLLAKADRIERDSVFPIPLRTNDYRYVLALLYSRARRFDEAIARFQDALGWDVGLYMANVQMAVIYEARSDWDAAVAQFEQALAVNPDDPSLLLELGLAQWEANRLEAAEESMQRAAAGNPLDPRVPYFLGRLQIRMGKTAAARASLTRFLAIAPSRLEEQRSRARALLAQLP